VRACTYVTLRLGIPHSKSNSRRRCKRMLSKSFELWNVRRKSITSFYSNYIHTIYWIHISITIYLLHDAMFVSPSSGRRLTYWLISYLYMLSAMLLQNVQYGFFLYIYNAVTIFKTIYISSYCILRKLIKILDCKYRSPATGRGGPRASG